MVHESNHQVVRACVVCWSESQGVVGSGGAGARGRDTLRFLEAMNLLVVGGLGVTVDACMPSSAGSDVMRLGCDGTTFCAVRARGGSIYCARVCIVW